MENTKKKNTKYRIKFKFAGSGDYVWRKPFEYGKLESEFEEILDAIKKNDEAFELEHEHDKGYQKGNEEAKKYGYKHYNTNIGKYHSNTDFQRFNGLFYDISRYENLKDFKTILNEKFQETTKDKAIGFVVENLDLVLVSYRTSSKDYTLLFFEFNKKESDLGISGLKNISDVVTMIEKKKRLSDKNKVLFLWEKEFNKKSSCEDFKLKVLDLMEMENKYGKMISQNCPIWVKTRIKYKDGQKIEQTEFTITGPMCRGGIADFGEHSIKENVNRSVPIMEGIINGYIKEAKQNEEDKLKKVEMVIKGHSRGGVAANIVTNKIIDEFRNNSNIVSGLELETVAFDPVPGKDNDYSPFNPEYQNITIEGLDQDESKNLKHGTVVYAMHSSHNFSIKKLEPGFNPQDVKNARVVIISDVHWDAQFTDEAKVNEFLHYKKLGHGVGLDDFEYFSINGKIKKVRKHCYYYNCEGVENHSNVVERWNTKDETELAINTRKGANLGIYSPGRLYELPDGFYWSKNFVLKKLDCNNENDTKEFEKIIKNAKFSENRGEMIKNFFYRDKKQETNNIKPKLEDVLKCLEQCTKWNINTVCPYIESKFKTFGFTEEEIKYTIDVIKGKIKHVSEKGKMKLLSKSEVSKFNEFLNKMLDKKRFTSSKGVNIGNIIQKLSELKKKFSEYGNYSDNKIDTFIKTFTNKNGKQKQIKDMSIKEFLEKIEEFLTELFKLFKVKGLLAFGDIIASEIRELIDEFDEKKPEQSYHRLMKLKEKLNDFDPKEDKNIDIDKIKEYWKNLKECISDYMVKPIEYKIKELIKNKSHNCEEFENLYKDEYEKVKIDEQIKRDKKSKEDTRREDIRNKLIKFFKERK